MASDNLLSLADLRQFLTDNWAVPQDSPFVFSHLSH